MALGTRGRMMTISGEKQPRPAQGKASGNWQVIVAGPRIADPRPKVRQRRGRYMGRHRSGSIETANAQDTAERGGTFRPSATRMRQRRD